MHPPTRDKGRKCDKDSIVPKSEYSGPRYVSLCHEVSNHLSEGGKEEQQVRLANLELRRVRTVNNTVYLCREDINACIHLVSFSFRYSQWLHCIS